MKLAAIIPHYRHIKTLPQVIVALQKENIPVFEDDGGRITITYLDLNQDFEKIKETLDNLIKKNL